MKKIKILNGHAGLGGNRKDWPDEEIEVTAVEIVPEIASEYQKNFPQDTVIVGDVKEYLISHFREFDFIWLSPPCPTHSRMRTLWKGDGKLDNKTAGESFKMPDMDLYSFIIFLQHFYEGNWVVENVISYYEPLIKPNIIDNHYFWSNKPLGSKKATTRGILEQDLEKKSKHLGMPIPTAFKSSRANRKLLNNCVKPEVGRYIFDMVFKEPQQTLQ